MTSGRTLALAALDRWGRGTEFADRIVAETFARSALSPADRAFALELFYGVLRNLTLLDFWIRELRSAPVDPSARNLRSRPSRRDPSKTPRGNPIRPSTPTPDSCGSTRWCRK